MVESKLTTITDFLISVDSMINDLVGSSKMLKSTA